MTDVRPGQRFRPDAATMNELIRSAKRGPLGKPRDLTPETSTQILIKNKTGVGLDRFSIVAVGGAVFVDPVGSCFADRRVMDGDTPSASATIAVLQEPANVAGGSERIAEATIVGLTPCKVDLTDVDHNFAAPTTSTTQLTSSAAGPARILWVESDTTTRTTGVQWAVVLLGAGGGEVTGNSGPISTAINIIHNTSTPKCWEWLGYDGITDPVIPEITEAGTWVLTLFLRWNWLDTPGWINLSIEDPGPVADVYGPGFKDGVAYNSVFRGTAIGAGGPAGSPYGPSFGGGTTTTSAQPSWIFNVKTVPYTPIPLIAVKSDFGRVEFNVGFTSNTLGYSLVRLVGATGIIKGTLGDGTTGGGGTGRTSFDVGQVIYGDGTDPLRSLASSRVTVDGLELKLATDRWVAFTKGSH